MLNTPLPYKSDFGRVFNGGGGVGLGEGGMIGTGQPGIRGDGMELVDDGLTNSSEGLGKKGLSFRNNAS